MVYQWKAIQEKVWWKSSCVWQFNRSYKTQISVYVIVNIETGCTHRGEQVKAAQPANDTVNLRKARSFSSRLWEKSTDKIWQRFTDAFKHI